MEKFKVDGDVLAASLECPVCFNVPRDLPIPQCPSGHIVCNECRRSLSECPTCRRRLFANNNSSIAAFLIDHIPHKCKFNEFGCEHKGLLSDLKIHEKKCPERTVLSKWLQQSPFNRLYGMGRYIKAKRTRI